MRLLKLSFFSCILLFCSSCLSVSTLQKKQNECIDYLSKAPFRFDYVYLYAYLAQHHKLEALPQLQQLDFWVDSLQKDGGDFAQKNLLLMKKYQRLVDPKANIEEALLRSSVQMDSLMLVALYCDQHEVELSSYIALLEQELLAGDYRTTHPLLMLLWLKENNCVESKALKDIQKLALAANKQLIKERNGNWDDIAIESLTLMQALGKKIPNKSIKKILANQLADGGWAETIEANSSSSHTTIMVLWLLTRKISK